MIFFTILQGHTFSVTSGKMRCPVTTIILTLRDMTWQLPLGKSWLACMSHYKVNIKGCTFPIMFQNRYSVSMSSFTNFQGHTLTVNFDEIRHPETTEILTFRYVPWRSSSGKSLLAHMSHCKGDLQGHVLVITFQNLFSASIGSFANF